MPTKFRTLKKSVKDFMEPGDYKKFVSLDRDNKIKVKKRIQAALNGELKNGIILQLKSVLQDQKKSEPKRLEVVNEALTFDEVIGLFPSLVPAYEELKGEHKQHFDEWLRTKLPPYLFAISNRVIEQYYAEETGDTSEISDAEREVALTKKQALVPIVNKIKEKDPIDIPNELSDFVSALDSRIQKVAAYLSGMNSQFGDRNSYQHDENQQTKQTAFDWSRAEGALKMAKIIRINLKDFVVDEDARKELYTSAKELAFETARKEKDRIKGSGVAAGILAVAEFVANYFNDMEEEELERQEDRIEEPVSDVVDVDNEEVPAIASTDSKDKLQPVDNSPNIKDIASPKVDEFVQQQIEKNLAEDQKKIFDVVDRIRKNKVVDTVLQRTSPVRTEMDGETTRVNAKKHFQNQVNEIIKTLFNPGQANVISLFKDMKEFVDQKVSQYLSTAKEKQQRYEQRIEDLENTLSTKKLNKEKQIKMKRRINSAKRSLKNLKFIVEFLPNAIKELNLNIDDDSLRVANELRNDDDVEEVTPEPAEGDREMEAKADAETAEVVSDTTGSETEPDVKAAIQANNEEPDEELDNPDSALDESDPLILKLMGGSRSEPLEALLQMHDKATISLELFKNGEWKLYPTQPREKVSLFLQKNGFNLGQFNRWLLGEEQ